MLNGEAGDVDRRRGRKDMEDTALAAAIDKDLSGTGTLNCDVVSEGGVRGRA